MVSTKKKKANCEAYLGYCGGRGLCWIVVGLLSSIALGVDCMYQLDYGCIIISLHPATCLDKVSFGYKKATVEYFTNDFHNRDTSYKSLEKQGCSGGFSPVVGLNSTKQLCNSLDRFQKYENTYLGLGVGGIMVFPVILVVWCYWMAYITDKAPPKKILFYYIIETFLWILVTVLFTLELYVVQNIYTIDGLKVGKKYHFIYDDSQESARYKSCGAPEMWISAIAFSACSAIFAILGGISEVKKKITDDRTVSLLQSQEDDQPEGGGETIYAPQTIVNESEGSIQQQTISSSDYVTYG